MTNDLIEISNSERLASTLSGAQYKPSLDRWVIYQDGGKSYVSFEPLRTRLPNHLVEGAKRVAEILLRAHSVNTVRSGIDRLIHLSKNVSITGDISMVHLMSLRSLLNTERVYYLGQLAVLLKAWVNIGIPGVNPDVLFFYRDVTITGNEKGAAVRQSCPHRGPFTDIELQAMVASAREAFRMGVLSAEDFAILLILVGTGCRGGQISKMICGDLLAPEPGSTAFCLLVPSLKKRTKDRPTRKRPIARELSRLLQDQVRRAEQDSRLRDIEPSKRPLFISNYGSFPDPMMAHIGHQGVNAAIQRIVAAIAILSERTGKPITATPKRFRSTFATRAVEEGYPPTVVADMLDHVDLQNVSVYVENRSTIVDRMDAALARKLGPIARLFLGQIIGDESEAPVADPASRRVGIGHSSNIGTCGGPSGCAKRAPIACYLCASFLPWIDAPHERLMLMLIAERERLLDSGIDARIAGVNDAAILAVADVIDRCKTHAEAAVYG